ncbi:oxygen-independent coproporphyrinogen III oxidase [Blastochloris viridis]|uniref:Coproporphyrinogen-III oxidase n=1 Tax=Blastochloris viridis TaxID=1079 RepID=A0A0H5BEA5_BLAVI|nr:oxygen-independent coproporphyrinogen III oxidase [Blastochloris viridis]ALK10646.1 Oxygen-independent coproporphyrinogen-III oxidase [Blastochloris viridis]BAR99394.1 coproporphyrinogen III oxidase [Blastochloris viridis]CUU43309.1 Oxygen-independent coproporphyrinogen-III oxidase [Blastochloris viridis]
MTDTPILLAERTVPRYTSYPTAPHFSTDVGSEQYGAWLEALPADATLSIYLHVPFCAQMCWYCGCHTKVVRRREPVEAYAHRLVREVELIGARAGGRRIVHIHWGGGTPNMLGSDEMLRVAATLKSLFVVDGNTEHAVELDPRQVTQEQADTLAAMGVTRASLGVQDFSDHVQQVIGRVQPFSVVDQAVANLRRVGIDKLNVDLMYGLPKQTLRDVRRTVVLAEALKPNRLALFGYAHVPWFKSHQKLIEEADLPSPAERLEQAETAHETLQGVGYVPIGLDHFARPDDDLALAARDGRLHRNFQGYTTDEADALLGIGASSIGRVPQGFIQNAPDIAGWSRAIDDGKLATVRGIAVSADDKLRASIIERLMCDFSVDLDAQAAAFGAADLRFGDELTALEPLATQGLIEIEGRHIAVTEAGRPFVRLAAAAFDTYLSKGKARHSMAV